MSLRTEEFDVVVVGGGTAGLVTAAGCAGLGARTALVERHRLGGECLWTGCVPSKALVASARAAHTAARLPDFGLAAARESGLRPADDGAAVLESVRAVRARIQPHDDPERFREMGVEVVHADARFTGPRAVDAGGRRLRGRKVVVATGSRPAVPPVEGLEAAGFFTHEKAFDRETLPASVVILGAGAVGVELGQAYARLGVDTTLVEMAPRILPREDAEMSERLTTILRGEGVRVLTGRRASGAARAGEGRRLELERADASGSGAPGRTGDGPMTVGAAEILVAAGRRPNVEGLGLEAAGLELREDGTGIRVDGKLRARGRHVFAAGDVIGGYRFTHVADHEARTVVRNALFPFPVNVDYSAVPWVIFSDPELARVGPTEAEAREAHGEELRVHRYEMAELDRAVAERATAGMVKLLVGRRGRVVGAHVLGAGAGSVITGVALAMRHGATADDISELVHPYPTMGEGVRRAADAYRRSRLTPGLRRWLDRYLRVARALGL